MIEDINQQILAELRKLKRVFYVILVFLILVAGPTFIRIYSRVFSRDLSQASPSWSSVDTAMSVQDFPKALADAQTLVSQDPNYFYGQAYLGLIHLTMGNLTNAEIHYLRAYEIFPDEQGQKALAAVRKRIAEQQPMSLLSK